MVEDAFGGGTARVDTSLSGAKGESASAIGFCMIGVRPLQSVRDSTLKNGIFIVFATPLQLVGFAVESMSERFRFGLGTSLWTRLRNT